MYDEASVAHEEAPEQLGSEFKAPQPHRRRRILPTCACSGRLDSHPRVTAFTFASQGSSVGCARCSRWGAHCQRLPRREQRRFRGTVCRSSALLRCCGAWRHAWEPTRVAKVLRLATLFTSVNMALAVDSGAGWPVSRARPGSEPSGPSAVATCRHRWRLVMRVPLTNHRRTTPGLLLTSTDRRCAIITAIVASAPRPLAAHGLPLERTFKA